jgi:hypothetical protein
MDRSSCIEGITFGQELFAEPGPIETRSFRSQLERAKFFFIAPCKFKFDCANAPRGAPAARRYRYTDQFDLRTHLLRVMIDECARSCASRCVACLRLP